MGAISYMYIYIYRYERATAAEISTTATRRKEPFDTNRLLRTHARSGIGDYYTATVRQTWESLHRNRSARRVLGADVAKKIQGNANYSF